MITIIYQRVLEIRGDVRSRFSSSRFSTSNNQIKG